MNRRETFAPLFASLCLGGAGSRCLGATSDAMDKAAQLIQPQVDAGMLNAAVLRVERGGGVFERAYGRAAPDSMFLLGSITKPYTAAAVMLLVDRGELGLADKAVQYLPEFSEGARRDITLLQLLNHTSGLPDQLPNNAALRASHAPLSEFVEETVRTPLLFAPGTKYHYQSMGILLAAEIVECVTQMKLPAFLEKEVFGPLGMTRSALGLGRFKKADMMPMQTEHAAPESGAGDPAARNWDWNSDYWRNLAAPWGGAHSSAHDVAAFLNAFLRPDGRVWSAEAAKVMVQNHTPGLEARRGVGFMLGPEGFAGACSEKSFGHSGSTGTLCWADPALDTTFVMLTSLPKNVSGELLLKPVSELVAGAKV